MSNADYKGFCKKVYLETWESEFQKECAGRTSKNAIENARRAAQRKATDKAFISALQKYYPEVSEDQIWDAIGVAHKLNVAQLSDFGIAEDLQASVMERCVSARQSWTKSSGHAFERYIAQINNEALEKNEIEFVLQSGLTQMIKKGQLNNTPDDIKGLLSWGKDFDLYAIQSIHGEKHVFGCIQSKTSIRDRVGRDVTFSQNAMSSLFWSVAVTLDGDFLNMPEFVHMVNGGGSYNTNGWHGMYAMSGINNPTGRIYKVDDSLDLFAAHAIAAAKQFIADRRQLNNEWMPK